MFLDTPLAEIMPRDALPLGLGCSRLGSVNGASGDEARRLLHVALDQGVRFFDTANIYAQGDSERLIAEVLGQRDDCVVCSKAGKYLTWRRGLLVPLKGVLRGLVRRSEQARRGVTMARSNPMPTRWDAAYLLASIDGSLRRLRRPRIELFMLHSPTAEVIGRGESIGAIEAARVAGKIGMIGVSVDDAAAAKAALKDTRVQALQIPLRPGETGFDDVLKLAARNGVVVVAREILGGTAAITRAVDPEHYARERIAEVVGMPEVALPLVGVTKLPNLMASTEAVRFALAPKT